MPWLPAGLAAFVISYETARSSTKFDQVGKALGRMPREVQHEILMEVRDICHTALAWKTNSLIGTFNPGIIGAAVNIHLCDGDHLVGNSSLLVMPVIGIVASPNRLGGLEIEGFAQ